MARKRNSKPRRVKRPLRRNLAINIRNKSLYFKTSSDGSLTYTGPLRWPGGALDVGFYQMTTTNALSSDSSGNFLTVASNTPGNFSEYSALKLLWDEYRVLSMAVYYSPAASVPATISGSSLVLAPIFVVADRDTATALTSYSNADNYASVKRFELDRRWSFSIRMSGVTDVTWLNLQSTASNYWMKFYSTGLTPSINYGVMSFVLQVELRQKI